MNAFNQAMKQNDRVTGWVRELEPGACQLCTWWWRDGQVWHKDHEMPTHKGCTCVANPVTR
ncbi:hypothetical protein H0264_21385 [Nocardia huaxiensis]|uniref:Phage head morphogenesis domain-containing protein n=1 Tax=Nocardia huaxiensis TaxID=2755382 RepID=A0A7D6V5J2_9NOCA|nr:hypothetical protein [Nocardia huaxiensis]QLY27972.1 hypothetical protein H0264_21385 [Nocardia huaxiensis]